MKTSKYYASNAKARAKKAEYDTEYHSTRERKKYRAYLNKKNRDAGTYGNGDGKDWDHDERRMIPASRNRAKKMEDGGILPIGRLAKEKKRARGLREGYKPTANNETHRMGLWEDGEGKTKRYIVAPTIYPKDKEGNYEQQSIYQAIERGETFEFKNKRIAERFGYGSWKKGQARREAMANYRADKKAERKNGKEQ